MNEGIAMRNRILTIVSSLSICFLFITIVFADNPIIQTSFTADPAPMVYHDTLFLYTGDDSICLATNSGFLMRYWKCYTTTDMANWTYRAIILPTKTISWITSGDANAAQCIYRNGKFYFYFPTGCKDDGNLCALGVAVADNPLGPFTDIGKPLIKGSQMTGCNANHGWRGLDPSVFIDDDQQAYLYWGNNVCYWVKLKADMISYNGPITCIAQNDPAFAPDFEEAPWIYKRNGLWYLLYASSIPEKIGYSTSPNPTGPWKSGGIIMRPVSGDNGNHPAYIEYKGNSYLFSFRDKSGLPGASNFRRSICMEQFTYNIDGTIPTVVFSKSGPPQIGHLNPYDTTQAETICWSEGLRAEPCKEGGMDIDSIHNGDYIKVKGVDFGSGALSFDARVASATSGGNIELHLDTLTGPLVGTSAVAGTGGWQTWATKSCAVNGATGVHDLYLRFTGGSGMLFNFNWWKFSPVVTETKRVGSRTERVNKINIIVKAGKTPSLRLDFSEPVSYENLSVYLFDLSGRLVATLFTGRLTSPHLTLPINREKIRTGTYLIKAILNDKVVLMSDNVKL